MAHPSGSITSHINYKIDFALTKLSATKIVTWNCHVDDYAKGRYDMILGRDLLTGLGLNIKFSDHIIKADDILFKGFTTIMVDLGA